MRVETVSGGTFFDSVLELYSGCPTEENKTCLAVDDDARQRYTAAITWDSELGQDYYVFVRGYKGDAGMFTLHVLDLSEPDNSYCPKAIEIIPNQRVIGYTTYAGGFNATCKESSTLRHGLWYMIHANESGTIALSSCDDATAFETEIEIYEECTANSATGCVNHTHDRKCAQGESLTFPAKADQDYYIFVTGVRDDINVSGVFSLIAAFRAPAPPVVHHSSSISSSDSYVDNALEIVEFMLIVISILWVATIVFTVVCCFYKKKPANYVQMVSASVDAPNPEPQSSGYVAPSGSSEMKSTEEKEA